MKKSLKNIILLVLMLMSVIGIFITINHAKDNLKPQNEFGIRDNAGGRPIDDDKEFGDRPEMPNNEIPDNSFENIERNMRKNEIKLDSNHIIFIVLFSLVFVSALLYLIMSLSNLEFYKSKDKLVIYLLSNIILTSVLSIGVILVSNKFILNSDFVVINDSKEKEKVTLDTNKSVSPGEINLTNENSDITIRSQGTYIFNGNFNHAIIVDANNEEVEIVLDGVRITNDNTATIIGLSASKIKIKLEDDSENILTDGGNSEYDGCIFSNAPLEFFGNGKLIVNGKQEEGEGIATEAQDITINSGTYIITSNDDAINAGGDGATITVNDGIIYLNASGDAIDSNKDAVINGGKLFVIGSDIGGDAGIDTEDGYVINGGLVVALGSDMIETPKNNSKQKTIAFTLNEKIEKNTLLTLMKGDEVIVSFEAPKSYKTIIVSSNKIEDGTYTLYKGGSNTGILEHGIYNGGNYTKGEIIEINNIKEFKVSNIINYFGNKNLR